MSDFLNSIPSAAIPKLIIEIPASPDFTGRLVINLENGKLKCWQQPRPDEFTGTIEVFVELAKQAGWVVTLPKEKVHEA